MKTKIITALKRIISSDDEVPFTDEDRKYFTGWFNDPSSDPFDKDWLPQVKQLSQSDDFELIFDGNDEFWILNVGYPVWRSSDYLPDEAADKWNEYALDHDKLTGERLKALNGDKPEKDWA